MQFYTSLTYFDENIIGELSGLFELSFSGSSETNRDNL